MEKGQKKTLVLSSRLCANEQKDTNDNPNRSRRNPE
jgi:hypothetical protein